MNEFNADYQVTHLGEIPERLFVTVGYLEHQRLHQIEVEKIKAKGQLDTRKPLKESEVDSIGVYKAARDRKESGHGGFIFSA